MQLHMQYVEKMYDDFGDLKETVPYPLSSTSTVDRSKTAIYKMLTSTASRRPTYLTTCSDKNLSKIGCFIEGERGYNEVYEYSI